MHGLRLVFLAGLWLATSLASAQPARPDATPAAPLTIGETFTIESKVLGETRRINVYRPPSYDDSAGTPRPVLYMPDGGIAEDFLHVAGLLQVSTGNGTMRPFLLVGIENTQRRRDLTGPTDDPEDRKIARRVGGSAAFRSFIRTELMPVIRRRYPTTDETAIMGESLAGLFVVETLFEEPDLFDTYIAFDPSLWWNRSAMVSRADPKIDPRGRPRRLYFASSRDDRANAIQRFADRLRGHPITGLAAQYESMPEESHATIYHPAALRAVRKMFPPASSGH